MAELRLVIDDTLHLFGERWVLVPPAEVSEKTKEGQSRMRSIVASWTEFCIQHKEALQTITKEQSSLNRLCFVLPLIDDVSWVELPPKTIQAISDTGLPIDVR